MRSWKPVLLFAVIVSLSGSALLAIAILLFGHFGETEGRILGTTALVAGYGLLALPAGLLFDQARLLPLATLVLGLSAAGFVLAVAGVWTSQPPAELGKSMATVSAFALASTQTSALAARRRGPDPPPVRRLFGVSVALAVILASMVTAAAWAELDRQGYYRVVAALAVLDVLVVALQPILTLTRPAGAAHELRMLIEPGEEIELTIEAADFATAAAKAIRMVERGGHRVLRLERIERAGQARRRTPVLPARHDPAGDGIRDPSARRP